ncbi:hypothetical protein JEQ01_14095 [Serratia marcescens]|nr:hypothetical protein [Serratia marcescens]HEJ7933595.1 hypothetical protein [Serratia marcescens]
MNKVIYHYTSRNGLTGIMKDGVISLGIFTDPNSKTNIPKFAVSLTTSLDHRGHGLTAGEQITTEQANYLGGYSIGKGINKGKIFSENRIKYRLELDVSKLKLSSAKDIYKKEPELFRLLEITGHYPLLDSKKDNDAIEVMRIFNNPLFSGQGDTWFYSFSPIPLEYSIIAVHVLNQEGTEYLACDYQQFLHYWHSENK